MNDSFVRMDLSEKPKRQWRLLRDVIRVASIPYLLGHRPKITRSGVKGLKPPYLLLCNHNAFEDFFVAATCIYPHRANYVVAIDGFTTPKGKDGFVSREKLMRAAGCICKRKFTSDVRLVRQLARIKKNGDVAVIYPEARYSLCGTTAVLPKSVAQLCKLLKIPVVTLICHGHHVNSPFWHVGDRGVAPTEAEFSLLLSPEEVASLSVDEIDRRLVARFQYDDFAWQKERGIRVTDPRRAEGLHRVLYQCPACKTEYRMKSEGDTLSCSACGKVWHMTELGELTPEDGRTEFSHIPDWYEWERANVRAEVEQGRYRLHCRVHVASLPNSDGYIDLGSGEMTHDLNGFSVHVRGKYGEFSMEKPALSLYSCHIEYDYLNRYGDCVDLNTLDDTWYTYPEGEDFSVTKIALATEEIYAYCENQRRAKEAAVAPNEAG